MVTNNSNQSLPSGKFSPRPHCFNLDLPLSEIEGRESGFNRKRPNVKESSLSQAKSLV